MFSTGVKFQKAAAGMKIFGVTTHQHQLGTGVKVWASSAPGDTSKQLLDELSTSAPPKDREVEAAKARARAEQRFAA